jgi:2-polyprenyl-6-methoxyphenol hydroxylase-like FAD-dependent oxidoreductase
MSPIGGVGINLAIQDAVAAANILVDVLRSGTPAIEDLRKVQHRREWPARFTQRMQIIMQDNVMTRVLQLKRDPKTPLAVKLLSRFPVLQRIPAYLIGVGVRPEHVRRTLRGEKQASERQ